MDVVLIFAGVAMVCQRKYRGAGFVVLAAGLGVALYAYICSGLWQLR